MDATAEDIQSQKANIEAETAELEQEVAQQEQEVASMEQLSGSLDDGDSKIEDLTSAGGKLEYNSLLPLTTCKPQPVRSARLRPPAMRLLSWSIFLLRPTTCRTNLLSLAKF